MSAGSPSFRVAVVGAGPAGFYLVERLLARADVEVDLFERLPAPYGLVRYGVAPDHEKIRNVTRVFDKIAANPRFRFLGNVEVGRHLQVADLRRWYDQVAFTSGAQTDRRMGIPGEDLVGSHTATEFVAWYNGHPDYRDRVFDLSAERVAVVGVGNVAVDVARILCRTPEELAATDRCARDCRRGRARSPQPRRRGRRGRSRHEEEARDPEGIRAALARGQGAHADDPVSRVAGRAARRRGGAGAGGARRAQST
jgi:NADPH-dependent glutamate synthase beta subunit-like oxidoreductase